MIYSYRKAEQTEKEDLFKLYCLVMRDYISAIWGWDDQWQENDFSSHFDSEGITLAHKEQELAGYSHVENRDGQIFIRMIVVHPRHQRKGIGSKLLESVIAAGKEQSKGIGLEVFKINHEAKKFYERYGFKVEDETSSSYVMSLMPNPAVERTCAKSRAAPVMSDVRLLLTSSNLYMPFDHRLLWSSNHVRTQLQSGHISELATFAYFLAIMAFDWLQFTQIATTPTPTISAWSVFNSWATFVITVLGLLYLFRKNGGSSGHHFLIRYFPLSITVGWKFFVASYACMWLAQIIFAQYGRVVLGWASVATLAVINCAMFWRIGFHLQVIAKATVANTQAKAKV